MVLRVLVIVRGAIPSIIRYRSRSRVIIPLATAFGVIIISPAPVRGLFGAVSELSAVGDAVSDLNDFRLGDNLIPSGGIRV